MSLIQGRQSLLVATTVPLWAAATVYFISSTWLKAVHRELPEPYLDEVFHVGQAQAYLAGNWTRWDPKITTPPGLYVLSTALSSLGSDDVVLKLRALGASLLPCLFFLVYSLPSPQGPLSHDRGLTSRVLLPLLNQKSMYQLHAAFNICLFPPLFFFSGLYYTDVASTISVYLFWTFYTNLSPSVTKDCLTVTLGLFTLTFRQTNIFWVSVFPAGLDLIDYLANHGGLHDPSIQSAYADDYIHLCLSLIRAFWTHLSKPLPILRLLLPYCISLSCFAAFIAWNGGVVLGDKSNHVATLHLAQMLYIWPYIAFFSWPLLLPYLIQGLISLLSTIPGLQSLQSKVVWHHRRALVSAATLTVALALSATIVRHNTIVHPFTLADNRHYVFYMFKILLRHPSIKYAAISVYLVGAWSVIQALGAPLSFTGTALRKGPGTQGTRISFVLLWVGTCMLQLATAPLVEPRYLIVPWIMWRLHVSPLIQQLDRAEVDRQTPRAVKQSGGTTNEKQAWLSTEMLQAIKRHDHRPWLETFWFLIVNAVTAWIFLYRGFSWQQEPGKTQRFMW